MFITFKITLYKNTEKLATAACSMTPIAAGYTTVYNADYGEGNDLL